MLLSTNQVEVVPVTLEPHPNADNLAVVQVYGYTVCVRAEDWSERTLGAYVPPDSLADVDRPEFQFLNRERLYEQDGKRYARIRAKKLRGVVSFGLLVPAPAGSEPGDNVADLLGVLHYEPALPKLQTGGEAEAAPAHLGQLAKYDVDSLRRYTSIFAPGERVLVTEKIHGANARYSFFDGRIWCGSRTEWKREDANNLWWKALANTPALRESCERLPGYVIYGEVYGDVQSMKYGCKPGECRFAAFDVLRPSGQFMNALDARDELECWGVPQVPALAVIPFDFESVCSFAEGPSTMPGADHIREGCVVKPVVERWHQSVGRVQLKVVGAGYLSK